MKLKKLLTGALLLLPALMHAQDDAKYLAGAVPEENGKVVFTTQLAIEKPKAEVYQTMKNWADGLVNREETIEKKTRVAYTNEEKGEIVVAAEEWMTFSSTGLALDRTRVYYNLRINCEDNSAKVQMLNIRYLYDENRNGGQRLSAEQQITDKEALNKDKTKMYKTIAKFRIKTIDLKDELFDSASKAFGSQTITTARIITGPGPAVISNQQAQAEEDAKKAEEAAAKAKEEKRLAEEAAAKAKEEKRLAEEAQKATAKVQSSVQKDTVTFTLQTDSPTAELLQKTGKATLTIISESGTAQVLQFQKRSEEKSKDGKICTFTGELSK